MINNKLFNIYIIILVLFIRIMKKNIINIIIIYYNLIKLMNYFLFGIIKIIIGNNWLFLIDYKMYI